jgi:hypothetical protein
MLVPVWWRSRAARFSLVVVLVSWLLMAVTKGAGTFVHHAVLLWPFPHLFVAATFAELRWRPLAAIAVAVLVAMNLLVINQYVLQFKRDGASRYFTDALNSLSDALAAHPSENIYVADWGIQNSVALLHQGRLHLQLIDGPLRTDSPTEAEQRQVASAFSDAKGIFVGWVQGQEALPGTRERLDRMAASIGLQRDLVQLVHDSHGRARFEIFRLADRGQK